MTLNEILLIALFLTMSAVLVSEARLNSRKARRALWLPRPAARFICAARNRRHARRDRAFNRKLREMNAREQEAQLQMLLDRSNADRETRRITRNANCKANEVQG